LTIKLSFVAIFFLTVLLMKWASWCTFDQNQKSKIKLSRYFFTTPLFQIKNHCFKIHPLVLTSQIFLYFFMLLIGISFLKTNQGSFHKIELQYILAPFIYVFTCWMSAMGQMLAYFFGHNIPPMHQKPYLAKSLNDFWSNRWNNWVRDWLRQISRHFFSKNRVLLLFYSFVISGLFHELMVSLPYAINTGKSVWGLMMTYFAIQGLGFFIEKKFLSNNLILKKIWCWTVIILPSPLFVNDAMLSFWGFKI
jgi:hypothetical protein